MKTPMVCRVVALLFTGIISVAPASAATPPTLSQAEQEHARKLVAQLSSPSFKTREQAGEQLIQMGRAVESILREGFDSNVPEIRSRCRRILPLAMNFDLEKHIKSFLLDKEGKATLPCWARFQQLVGNTEESRLLFVDLVRTEPEFFDEIERNAPGLDKKFQAKCMEFMTSFNFGQGAPSTEQLAVMLFAALDPALRKDNSALSYLSSGLHTLSYQPQGKSVLKTHPIIRKLLIEHLTRTDSSTAYNNLFLVANLELKEGVDIAMKIIKAPNRDTYSRMMAVSILGKIGGKEHITEILPFLTDSTNVGSVRFGNGPQINTQLRDVALAALIQLSGQNSDDYNFPYLKMFPNRANVQLHLSPNMMGFSDEPTRTASIKKWKDWYEKNKAAGPK